MSLSGAKEGRGSMVSSTRVESQCGRLAATFLGTRIKAIVCHENPKWHELGPQSHRGKLRLAPIRAESVFQPSKQPAIIGLNSPVVDDLVDLVHELDREVLVEKLAAHELLRPHNHEHAARVRVVDFRSFVPVPRGPGGETPNLELPANAKAQEVFCFRPQEEADGGSSKSPAHATIVCSWWVNAQGLDSTDTPDVLKDVVWGCCRREMC